MKLYHDTAIASSLFTTNIIFTKQKFFFQCLEFPMFVHLDYLHKDFFAYMWASKRGGGGVIFYLFRGCDIWYLILVWGGGGQIYLIFHFFRGCDIWYLICLGGLISDICFRGRGKNVVIAMEDIYVSDCTLTKLLRKLPGIDSSDVQIWVPDTF